jgi:hypothetical protein
MITTSRSKKSVFPFENTFLFEKNGIFLKLYKDFAKCAIICKLITRGFPFYCFPFTVSESQHHSLVYALEYSLIHLYESMLIDILGICVAISLMVRTALGCIRGHST